MEAALEELEKEMKILDDRKTTCTLMEYREQRDILDEKALELIDQKLKDLAAQKELLCNTY